MFILGKHFTHTNIECSQRFTTSTVPQSNGALCPTFVTVGRHNPPKARLLPPNLVLLEGYVSRRTQHRKGKTGIYCVYSKHTMIVFHFFEGKEYSNLDAVTLRRATTWSMPSANFARNVSSANESRCHVSNIHSPNVDLEEDAVSQTRPC